MALLLTVRGQNVGFPVLSAAGVCAHLEPEGILFLESSAPRRAEKRRAGEKRLKLENGSQTDY